MQVYRPNRSAVCGWFADNSTTESGVARRLFVGGMLRPFFCFAKRKKPKKRRPDAAPLRGSQHFGKRSGHENNSAGGGDFYFKEAGSRHPQTIFVETPDPFPKCWRGNTGILECEGLCNRVDLKTMHARKKKIIAWVEVEIGNKKQNLKLPPLPRTEWCLHRKAGA